MAYREAFVTCSGHRNIRWVGHDSAAGVRRVLAYAHPDLQIFERTESGDYRQIPAVEWPVRFAK